MRITCITLLLVLASAGTGSLHAQAPVAAAKAAVTGQSVIEQLGAPETRDAARKELQKRGAEAVPLLLENGKHSDSHVRWEIANLLGNIGDRRAAPLLIDYVLREAHPHVRWRSLWAVSRVMPKSEVIALLRPALDDPDKNVQWNAAIALSFFDSNEGVAVLHAGVRSPDPFRRWEAINALGRTHDGTTIDVLRVALQSPSVRDRSEVVLSIGSIGGPKAVELLIESLWDESSDVRWRAAMVLGRAGDAKVIPELKRLVETDSDATVKEQAAKAIDRIERQTKTAAGGAAQAR